MGYEVNIPVIATRVALESKRGEGRDLIYPIVENSARKPWLHRRMQEICSEFRNMEKLIKASSKEKLFGVNSFPEADQLGKVKIANEESGFSYFINVMNRCFVESIENFGRSEGDGNYFWGAIKSAYPNLWKELHRIKVYRNERDHLHLNNTTCNHLFNYLSEDLEGKSFSQVGEPYFIIQQRFLDRLLLAILREIDQFN